jgi:aminoglycoside phosphotransferase (APT) family kinase protein
VSVEGAVEFFLLRDRLSGEPYYMDLDRIALSRTLTDLDRDRVDALADYLAGIHQKRRDAPALYRRRIRDTIGHGEGILGIVDAYPEPLVFPAERLARIEEACVRWRWRLRGLAHRLAMVHGDFHPWNILFQDGTEFGLLDRSRGEWGEPADDVAALTINYPFFGLARCGELIQPFAELFARFFDRYQAKSGDDEIGRALPLFYAFRGLVVASPLWYPDLTLDCRERLLRFVERVLAVEVFRPEEVQRLLEA